MSPSNRMTDLLKLLAEQVKEKNRAPQNSLKNKLRRIHTNLKSTNKERFNQALRNLNRLISSI